MLSRRPRVAAVLSATALSAGALVAASPPAGASASPPTPQIAVGGSAKIANDYSALVPVRVGCEVGANVVAFSVTATQGAVVGSTSAIPAVTCDGTSRVLTLLMGTNGPSFEPGPVAVAASVTVQYPGLPGGPTRTGTSTASIPMRAPAHVRIDRVVLRPDGSMAVDYALRCPAPWDPQVGSVQVTQNDGFRAGSALTLPVPVCNGVWQGRRALVLPGEGAWQPGRTVVEVSFGVLDPRTGDPVGAAGKRVVRFPRQR